jgi:hypothetical protein
VSDIKVNIIGEFQKKGFKDAEKATGKLDSSFKQLGKTLVGLFSAKQVIAFGKASIKAFEDDERATKRLSQSINNLGLAFEDARVTKFISDLETTSGVLDDQLRPAFQSLLTTTGSVAKSQELLNLALDVAAGSGQDVTTVAGDLTKAYVGNTRSLAKYNTGLSRAELQTASFAEVQTLLAKQFAGQNAAYLDTYAGKVAILNVAYANMQETIGKGLVDAFQILAGNQGIGGGVSAMDNFADSVADTTRGVALLVNAFKDLNTYGSTALDLLRNIDPFNPLGSAFGFVRNMGKPKPAPFKTPMTISGSTDQQIKIDRARAKAEAEAAKRAKELLELTKKQSKTAAAAAKKQQELQKLAKAKAVFDLEKIQIEAALKGKITEEERTRLLLMKAIAEENVGKTEELLKKLKEIQDENAKLAKQLTEFPQANDPFSEWGKTLNGVMVQLTAIAQKKIVVDFLSNFQFAPIVFPSSASSSAAAIAAVTSPAANAASSAASASANEAAGDAWAEIAKAQAAAAAAAEAAAAAAAAIAAAKSEAEKIAAEAAARAAEEAAKAALLQEEAATALLAAAAAQEAANAAAEAAAAQQVAEILVSEAAAKAAADALTEASFTFEESVMGAYGAGVSTNNIYVTVEGSVTAVEDLAQTITDIQYNYQRYGTDLRFSSIAI